MFRLIFAFCLGLFVLGCNDPYTYDDLTGDTIDNPFKSWKNTEPIEIRACQDLPLGQCDALQGKVNDLFRKSTLLVEGGEIFTELRIPLNFKKLRDSTCNYYMKGDSYMKITTDYRNVDIKIDNFGSVPKSVLHSSTQWKKGDLPLFMSVEIDSGTLYGHISGKTDCQLFSDSWFATGWGRGDLVLNMTMSLSPKFGKVTNLEEGYIRYGIAVRPSLSMALTIDNGYFGDFELHGSKPFFNYVASGINGIFALPNYLTNGNEKMLWQDLGLGFLMLTGPLSSGLMAADVAMGGVGLDKLIAHLGKKQGEYIVSGSEKAQDTIDAQMNKMSFEMTHKMRQVLAAQSYYDMSRDGYTIVFGPRIPM